jgi:hypothetical protein
MAHAAIPQHGRMTDTAFSSEQRPIQGGQANDRDSRDGATFSLLGLDTARMARELAGTSLRGALQLTVDIYASGSGVNGRRPDTNDVLSTIHAEISRLVSGREARIVRQAARRWRGAPERIEVSLTQVPSEDFERHAIRPELARCQPQTPRTVRRDGLSDR